MANFVIFRFLKKTKLSPCLLDMTEKKGMAGPGLDVVILSKASIGGPACSCCQPLALQRVVEEEGGGLQRVSYSWNASGCCRLTLLQKKTYIVEKKKSQR